MLFMSVLVGVAEDLAKCRMELEGLGCKEHSRASSVHTKSFTGAILPADKIASI